MKEAKQVVTTDAAGMPVTAGLQTPEGYDLIARQSTAFARSDLVPEQYRQWGKPNRNGEREENPAAAANCMIALSMASRMKMEPLMVMQNLYIVHGHPSWSSQFVIAAINNCGRFTPLEFEFEGDWEKLVDAEFNGVEWENNRKQAVNYKFQVPGVRCRAFATERSTGTVRRGPWVSMTMAVAEGWYHKSGSKWQTMAELMMHYRSASFFGRLYASELLMGYQTRDEVEDVIDITPEPDLASPDLLESSASASDPEPETKTEPEPEPVKDEPAKTAPTLKEKLKAKQAQEQPEPEPEPSKQEEKPEAKANEAQPKIDPADLSGLDESKKDGRGVILDTRLHTGLQDKHKIWEMAVSVGDRRAFEHMIDSDSGEIVTVRAWQEAAEQQGE